MLAAALISAPDPAAPLPTTPVMEELTNRVDDPTPLPLNFSS